MLGIKSLNLKWFSGKSFPIGIDFGADSLKIVQLARENGEARVLASGRRYIPPQVAADPASRNRFLTEALRDMLPAGPFKGRKAITCVPAEHFFVQHIRTPKMSEADLAKALPWEAQGKLPFPVRDAVLRHLLAGELLQDGETRSEVILMAAPRSAVERHLSAIARAKLEVQAVMVPPLAVVEAFRFLFTRANEQDMCTMFVDIGASHSTAVITHATHVVFVKQVPLGGQSICSALATRLDCSRQEAAELRHAMAEQAPAANQPAPDRTTELAESADAAAPPADTGVAVAPPPSLVGDDRAALIESTCHEQLERLARELGYCLRYYQSMFPDRPVNRLVLLGGESNNLQTCQQIARALRLPAMLGDPMLRLHRRHEGGPCGDLNPGLPAPEWAVAFGCSLAEPESMA